MTKGNRRDPLEHELRAEALGSTPGFSESLHRRVMDALANETASTTPIPHPARHWNWPMAAAAAVAIAASLAMYVSRPQTAVTPPQVHLTQRIEMPTPQELMSSMTAPLLKGLDDLHSQTYAAADTDARNLARFMARQLDLATPPMRVQ